MSADQAPVPLRVVSRRDSVDHIVDDMVIDEPDTPKTPTESAAGSRARTEQESKADAKQAQASSEEEDRISSMSVVTKNFTGKASARVNPEPTGPELLTSTSTGSGTRARKKSPKQATRHSTLQRGQSAGSKMARKSSHWDAVRTAVKEGDRRVSNASLGMRAEVLQRFARAAEPHAESPAGRRASHISFLDSNIQGSAIGGRKVSAARVMHQMRTLDFMFHREVDSSGNKVPILSHQSRPRQIWDILIMFLVLLYSVLLPLELAEILQTSSLGYFVMDWIFDIIFLFDLGLNFFTPYQIPPRDEWYTQPRLTAFHYART